ncbi:MAG TPA: DUF1826 domain-containing protein [Aliidongia sp.]|nr:DUF1826 domain-containing protein [Aliidongia sp.]
MGAFLWTDQAEILAHILEPAIDLVLWRRTMPAEFELWLDALAPARLPTGRVLVRPGAETREAVAAILDASGTPNGPMARLLAEDVVDLASRFAAIAASEEVDVRLDAIRNDACWKFHRDHVRLRLLTTYRGPGTEIAPPEMAERAMREQTDYSGPVETLDRHAVALFKGDRDDPGRGTVHRSPPIEGSGATRLMLCINLPSIASPDPWRGGADRMIRRPAQES